MPNYNQPHQFYGIPVLHKDGPDARRLETNNATRR
jgi:hypothetical protein